MRLADTVRGWLNQEHSSGSRRFLQMTALIAGGLLAMILGVLLVGVILIASPLLTVLILVFLALYGITLILRNKDH